MLMVVVVVVVMLAMVVVVVVGGSRQRRRDPLCATPSPSTPSLETVTKKWMQVVPFVALIC